MSSQYASPTLEAPPAAPPRPPESAPLWAGVAIYLILVVLLHPLYRYHINPDFTAYFSLAQKWTAGDWYQGTTGHWAPLLIWCLALLTKAGLQPFAAITVMDAIGAAVTLWGLDRMGRQLSLGPLRRLLVLALAAVWLVAFTFDEVTPDVLLCASMTWYLVLAVQGEYLKSARPACILGLVAGIAFLAKPYALYFIFLHLAIASFAARREIPGLSRRIRQFTLVALSALLLAGPWVALMSMKYRRLTVNSSGSMFVRVMSPRWPSVFLNNVGLVEPPNATAVSYWDDPEVDRLRLPPWSPFESATSFFYYLRCIARNILGMALWGIVASVASIPLLGILAHKWNRSGRSRALGLILLAILAYPAGYALLYVAFRYLWLPTLWLMVPAGLVLPLSRNGIAGTVLLLVSFLPYPLWCLKYDAGQGEIEHAAGAAIRRHSLAGRAASLDEWHRSLYVSYYAGLQYCGATTGKSAESDSAELKQFGIRYLILWPETKAPPSLLAGMREITDPDFKPVRVFAAP